MERNLLILEIIQKGILEALAFIRQPSTLYALDNNDDDDQLFPADQVSCQYYHSQTVNIFFENFLNHNLNIFHTNIGSVSKNYDELSITLNSFPERPDILVFSETRYNADTCEEILGYVGRHIFRSSRCGGGVSVYVSDAAISYTLNNNCFINDIMEITTVRVVLIPSCSITIVATYRPLA